jgi:hypothetical protein
MNPRRNLWNNPCTEMEPTGASASQQSEEEIELSAVKWIHIAAF